MPYDGVFSEIDRERAERTFRKLLRHDIANWALTGGFATEAHIERRGGKSAIRPLHDIDLIVSSFDCIPESLAEDFLLRHVHPDDPPGKTLLQCIDPETAVRVDVFRAYGDVMQRIMPIDLFSEPFRIISLADLTARAARLSWDLTAGIPVAPKYTTDFLRLLDIVSTDQVQAAWEEHRKPHSSERFQDAVNEIRRLICTRPDLLVSPAYLTDISVICERCRSSAALPLVDAGRMLELLGYC
jgi:hypothetical protein